MPTGWRWAATWNRPTRARSVVGRERARRSRSWWQGRGCRGGRGRSMGRRRTRRCCGARRTGSGGRRRRTRGVTGRLTAVGGDASCGPIRNACSSGRPRDRDRWARGRPACRQRHAEAEAAGAQTQAYVSFAIEPVGPRVSCERWWQLVSSARARAVRSTVVSRSARSARGSPSIRSSRSPRRRRCSTLQQGRRAPPRCASSIHTRPRARDAPRDSSHGRRYARTPRTSITEYRNLTELGGFVVSGPTSISEITNRFGAGEYSIAAYGLEARGLRWEVFATLVDTKPNAANPVERT